MTEISPLNPVVPEAVPGMVIDWIAFNAAQKPKHTALIE